MIACSAPLDIVFPLIPFITAVVVYCALLYYGLCHINAIVVLHRPARMSSLVLEQLRPPRGVNSEHKDVTHVLDYKHSQPPYRSSIRPFGVAYMAKGRLIKRAATGRYQIT